MVCKPLWRLSLSLRIRDSDELSRNPLTRTLGSPCKADFQKSGQLTVEYLKVRWLHAHEPEPILLLSELDDARMEVRKVEIFSDDRMGFASETQASGGTLPGKTAIPPTTEIIADPQLAVEHIDAAGFESAWHLATSRN